MACLACCEHGAYDTRHDIDVHLGGGGGFRHADSALCVCSPVALVVSLDEFALGDAFDAGLLGVETGESIGSAVGLPEEHVVEVHVTGELSAVKVDADGVHLGCVFKGELAFSVAEFNLVVLECSEVVDVAERNFVPLP